MTSEVKDEIKINEKEENIEEKNESNDMDFKALFYTHPSQKDKKKKDFTEYSRIDMNLLNKKRERENKKEENLDNENNDKSAEDKNNNNQNEHKEITKEQNEENEEKKENSLENNLPEELVELINQTKDNEPFTVDDFEKYKAYKKLNVNLYNK